MSTLKQGVTVPLGSLLETAPSNGYSPVCPKAPTGKWILGLSALSERSLDVSQAKPAPVDDALVDRFQLQPGDFLMSRSNSLEKVGRVGVFRGGLDKCSFSDLMMRFRPAITKVNPDYLEVYLRSDMVVKFIQKHAAGTSGSMKKINQTIVELIPVVLPSSEIQAKIALLHAVWESNIDKVERLINAQKKRIGWLRQQYLTGHKRLTGYSQGWKKVRLREILVEHRQLSTGNEEVYSVSIHKGVVNQVEHLGRIYAAENTSRYNVARPGDIIYTKSPTGNFPYGIIKQSKTTKDVIVSPLYGVFTPATVYLGTILDCYFESEVNTRNYLRPIIHKGAKNTMNITNTMFLSNSLYLPTELNEQKELAEIIDAARQEVHLLDQQVEAYTKQKRGLMQKLLTGERRVKPSGEVP